MEQVYVCQLPIFLPSDPGSRVFAKRDFSGQAARAKDVFAKHVDSLLSKCAKLRSLIGDLQKNYPEDDMARRILGKIGSIQQATKNLMMSVFQRVWCFPILFEMLGLCPLLPLRAVVTLNADINTLDLEFNKLSDIVARGDRDNCNEVCLSQTLSWRPYFFKNWSYIEVKTSHDSRRLVWIFSSTCLYSP